MTSPRSVIFDVIGRDRASAAFLSASRSADKAAIGIDRSIARMNAAGAKTAAIGQRLTKGITLPVVAIGAVSVDQAAKFQKSMTLIQTAGGETAAKTAVIGEGIKKLAVSTGTSLNDLSAGIYTIAKAGAQKWSATDQLLVLKAAAQGAKAEGVDLGVATDALTTIMFDFGASAKDAVGYQDMLIRGAGLAKTNMQEYAASLSNVVPIGAAVGLSFKEIAGAIGTMTQHGMSAQRATENLNNLIVNLSGQNSVASQAMQQLGINTVDLSKNLGTRGLSGTLAIVERALKAHTHNGMVVIDVHKAAALSARSLSQELGAMSGKLRTQSEGLLAGKVSIKDYTKFAKSLGGQAGAAALQFIALYKNSLGFSNQLRSGNGTISTTVQQLNKMLGGMTGSNVALMIGGKYAKENARNVREVGRAALDAGADVLGWNKTQGTLAVKLDKAKASLQVMAVEIGTALIPAIAKMVGWVQSAVHWFDGLSSGWKKFLGYAALTVAALGPILFIAGKVTRALALMWAAGVVSSRFFAGIRAAEISMVGMETTAYGMGLKVRGAFLGMGTSATAGAATVIAADGTVVAANDAAAASFLRLKGAGALGVVATVAAILPSVTGGELSAIKSTIQQYKYATNSADLSAKAFLRWGSTARDTVLPIRDMFKALRVGSDAVAVGVSGSDTQYKKFMTTLQRGGHMTESWKELLDILHKAYRNTATAAANAAKVVNPAATAMQKRITAIQTAINNIKQNQTPNVDINTNDANAKLAALQLQLQQAQAAMNVLAGGTPHDIFNDLPGAPSRARAATQTPNPKLKIPTVVDPFAASEAAAAAAAAKDAAKARSDAAKQAVKDAMAARVQAAQDRLTAAKQKYSDERSSVKSAITGSFDIGTSGQNQFNEPVTFSAIKRQLDKAVANAGKFTAAIKKLGREGLNRTLLSQLAEAGPAALPEALALAGATPKQLAAFNKQYRALDTAGGSAGKYLADSMYGAGVKSAQGLVNGLKSKQSDINKAIKNMGDQMVAQLRRTLNMHSPSRRLFDEARLAFQGYENGIQSKHADIARAAAGAGDASVPGGSGGRLGRGGNTYNIHNEMHAHYPLEGDLQEAVKTLTRMSARQMREAGEALGR